MAIDVQSVGVSQPA